MFLNLFIGLRTALGLSLQGYHYRAGWCAFWFIVLLGILTSATLDLALTPPPRLFQMEALLGETLTLFGVLLTAAVISAAVGRALQLRLSVAFLNATYWVHLISYLLFLGPLAPLLARSALANQLCYYTLILWYALVALRCVVDLTPQYPMRRLAGGSLLTLVLVLPAWYIHLPRFWEPDYQALQQAADTSRGLRLNAEQTLSHQWPLLKQAWATLSASAPGDSDLYFIGFAGHGTQDVFMKEVQFSRHLFDTRFATASRSITLVNNPGTADHAPLATVTNLEATLEHLNALIQPEEDLLFLFLTSHGSEDHQLSVTLPPLPLNDLSASTLGEVLAKSRFKWKIILVSACYSGGFIQHLQSPTSLVMTAARPDRTSFGCSDDADMTFFGRAYFSEALQRTSDFIEAFDMAREHVRQWESEADFTPSEPQIFVGDAIREKLRLRGD